MKLIALFSLLLLSQSIFGYSVIDECSYQRFNEDAITVKSTENEIGFEFSAPATFSEIEVSKILLFLTSEGAKSDVAIPVSFSVNVGSAVGNIGITGEWSQVTLVAYYGEDECDPIAVKEINI